MTATTLAADVDQSWWPEAACRGADPDLFFPARGKTGLRDADRAMAICARCTVRQRCYDQAHERRESQGIWGGVDFDPLRRNARARIGRSTKRRRP